MTLLACKTESRKTEISIEIDQRTLKDLKNFFEYGDLDATFTRDEILAHFRDVHGIGDEETVFLIAGEFFVNHYPEEQKAEIAAFMIKRNPRLVLSDKYF
jgi:hypothetical protein